MLHTSNKPDADLSAFYESWEEEYGKPEYNLKGFKIWFYFVFEKKKEGNMNVITWKAGSRKRDIMSAMASCNVIGELRID